jgi:hypothetical protein
MRQWFEIVNLGSLEEGLASKLAFGAVLIPFSERTYAI